MSTTETTAKMPAIPDVLVLNRSSIFFGSFIVGLISNLLLIVAVYAFGVSTGLEGEPSFSWEQLGSSVGFLFGGVPSLIALVGLLAIAALALWYVGWLSKNQHHKWVIVAAAVAFLLGGMLWPLVNWSEFGFGFVPFLALLAWTALWALVAMFLIPAFHNTLSRKRGTNH